EACPAGAREARAAAGADGAEAVSGDAMTTISRTPGLRRSLLALVTALSPGALLAAPGALAQARKPKPKQPVQQPAQPPAQPPAAPAQAAAPAALPQFVSTPWVKLCETQPNKICVTRALLRTDAGQPLALAEFAEPDGQPKILRIT